MKTPWDTRDNYFNLREEFGKLIACKISGVDPLAVIPSEEDLTLADLLGTMIEKEAESRERIKQQEP